ncbi:MAG: DUF3021 domain-containing protein [Bilifractor sp.]
MFRKMMKACFVGVTIAVLIFCFIGMVFDLSNGGEFRLDNYQFSKMLLGTVCTGIGFGLPSFIYENDRIPYPIQVVFHLGIGFAVLLITSFLVGWIPKNAGPVPMILCIVGDLVSALLIWAGLAKHYKKEAEKMNQQLHSINK